MPKLQTWAVTHHYDEALEAVPRPLHHLLLVFELLCPLALRAGHTGRLVKLGMHMLHLGTRSHTSKIARRECHTLVYLLIREDLWIEPAAALDAPHLFLQQASSPCIWT
jgi:hypothetical protein